MRGGIRAKEISSRALSEGFNNSLLTRCAINPIARARARDATINPRRKGRKVPRARKRSVKVPRQSNLFLSKNTRLPVVLCDSYPREIMDISILPFCFSERAVSLPPFPSCARLRKIVLKSAREGAFSPGNRNIASITTAIGARKRSKRKRSLENAPFSYFPPRPRQAVVIKIKGKTLRSPVR